MQLTYFCSTPCLTPSDGATIHHPATTLCHWLIHTSKERFRLNCINITGERCRGCVWREGGGVVSVISRGVVGCCRTLNQKRKTAERTHAQVRIMYLSERDDTFLPHSVSMGILRPRSRLRLVKAMSPTYQPLGVMGNVVHRHVLHHCCSFKGKSHITKKKLN